MKLSKAQQEVVEKMRQGWQLKYVQLLYKYHLSNPPNTTWRTVSCKTVGALKNLGVITCNTVGERIDIYYLTNDNNNLI